MYPPTFQMVLSTSATTTTITMFVSNIDKSQISLRGGGVCLAENSFGTNLYVKALQMSETCIQTVFANNASLVYIERQKPTFETKQG